MASASRAAYFPVSHQYQAFLKGLLPTFSRSSTFLQPLARTVSEEVPPTTRVPSFTPTRALALCLQPRPGPTVQCLSYNTVLTRQHM